MIVAPLRSYLSCTPPRRMISPGEGTARAIFDNASGRGRVIADGPGRGMLGLIGLGIVGFVVVILLFNCVTPVGTGQVGVITLFGKVTGETLPEGIHLINPLTTNNPMSVQTQTIKESATTPSSEVLMIKLDTSLITT
ncbi:MAG: hypothetical protein NVS1B11_20620 [Terriglobales bacterium]